MKNYRILNTIDAFYRQAINSLNKMKLAARDYEEYDDKEVDTSSSGLSSEKYDEFIQRFPKIQVLNPNFLPFEKVKSYLDSLYGESPSDDAMNLLTMLEVINESLQKLELSIKKKNPSLEQIEEIESDYNQAKSLLQLCIDDNYLSNTESDWKDSFPPDILADLVDTVSKMSDIVIDEDRVNQLIIEKNTAADEILRRIEEETSANIVDALQSKDEKRRFSEEQFEEVLEQTNFSNEEKVQARGAYSNASSRNRTREWLARLRLLKNNPSHPKYEQVITRLNRIRRNNANLKARMESDPEFAKKQKEYISKYYKEYKDYDQRELSIKDKLEALEFRKQKNDFTEDEKLSHFYEREKARLEKSLKLIDKQRESLKVSRIEDAATKRTKKQTILLPSGKYGSDWDKIMSPGVVTKLSQSIANERKAIKEQIVGIVPKGGSVPVGGIINNLPDSLQQVYKGLLDKFSERDEARSKDPQARRSAMYSTFQELVRGKKDEKGNVISTAYLRKDIREGLLTSPLFVQFAISVRAGARFRKYLKEIKEIMPVIEAKEVISDEDIKKMEGLINTANYLTSTYSQLSSQVVSLSGERYKIQWKNEINVLRFIPYYIRRVMNSKTSQSEIPEFEEETEIKELE